MASRLWISMPVIHEMLDLAVARAPFETGGILIGYIGDNGDGVVNHIVGPGPRARHSRFGFKPDHDYQMRKLEEIFKDTKKKADYLGDWHTHPDGCNDMSRKDKKTLTKIARSTADRLPNPYMLILSLEEDGWTPGGHRFVAPPARCFGLAEIERVPVKGFTP